MKKLKSFITAILIIACMACLSVGLVACGSSDDNSNNGGSQPAMTVGLNELDATLILGSKTESGLTLIATVTQVSGEEYTGEYIWKCEGTAVTILDNKETCVVQAAEVGTASVTVTVGNFSVTCNITVIENSVTKLILDKNTMSLAVDGEDAVNVTATLADGTAYDDFGWELSDETVASVAKTGSALTVTGLKEGKTTLIVSAGNLTAKCEITVGEESETHEHTFPAPGSEELVIEWKWDERDEASSTVKVVITCSGCGEKIEYTAGYTSDDGGKTLTASLTVGSNTYTSSYDVETGGSEEGGHAHSYTASWEWNDDYTCAVTLTCSDEDGECTEKTVTGTATVEKGETPATCTEDGSVVYTASFKYGDETYVCGETKTQTVPATGHTPVKVDAVEATCETAGSMGYWKCSVCGKMFSDETCENELTADDIVVPAVHKLEYVDAVSATCQSEGSIAYWKCSVCGRMFADDTGKDAELFADDIVTEKADHTPGSTYSYDNEYHYTTCTVCGTALEGEKHVFNENYVCETCDYANLLTDGTYGVVYSLVSGSTTEYEVTGFEEGVSAELLVIAPTYNGLPVVQIAQNAFQNNITIKEVVLQNNMTTLGNSAFYECYGLEKVTMTDVTTIGNKTFQKCTSLKEIDFGQKLTSLGSNAFNECSSLTYIELPATLTSIGQSCFKDCTVLVTVSLSEGLQSIATYAFNGCYALADLVIPKSVSYVGEGVFEDVKGPIYITNDKAYVDANWQQADNSDDKDPWDDEYSGEVYYYSETAPNDDGNYWHYNDEGEIEIWEYDPDAAGEEDIFEYTTVTGGFEVKGLKTGVSVTTLVIPETYEGEPVISIAASAFSGNKEITEVVMQTGMTKIGKTAFKNCSSLVSVVLPEGLQRIEYGAFAGCESLVNLVIPESVSYVGDSAFEDVKGPIYVTNDKAYVDANWQQYDNSEDEDYWYAEYDGEIYYYSDTAPSEEGDYWHYNDDGEIEIWEYNPGAAVEEDIFEYTAVTGGYQVTGLKDGVTATELVIPETCNDLPVVSIGEKAFNGNKTITKVVLGASVKEIGASAFMNCTALESVVFSDVLETIGSKAFSGCSALKDLVIPSTVSFVGEKAFGDGVTAVIYIENDEAFVTGNWQQRVRDPEDDDEWINAWNSDFSGDVYYYSDTEPELNADGTGYDGNYWHYVGGAVEIWVYIPADEYLELELTTDDTGYQVKGLKEGATVTEIIIPDTYNDLPVVSIGERAFQNNASITSVVFGANVTEIGSYAFYSCSGLTSVVLPESLTTIGAKAFEECNSLAGDIVISSSVTFVGEKAFNGVYANLFIENTETYTDSNWQKKDDDFAKWNNGFKGTAYYYSDLEPALNSDQTAYDGNFWHYVGGEIVVWEYVYEETDFVMVLVNDDTQYQITGLKDGVTVTDLVIPDTYDGLPVVSIGSRAFQSNGSIASVVVGANVTKISDYAFYGCSGLTSVVLPEGLTEIGAKAFSGCTGLTSDIFIPSSVSYVGEKAFEQVTVDLYVEKTKSQVSDTWQQVEKDSDGDIDTDIWSKSFQGTTYYYSEYEPELNSDQTAYEGDFWHYVDGEIVVWEYVYEETDFVMVLVNDDTQYQITGLKDGVTGTDLVIPDTYNGLPVVSIGSRAFQSNGSITSVVIGANVTKISDYAFYGCSGLTSVVLSGGLTEIGAKAFSGCTGLTSDLIIPSSVSYVGEKAFEQVTVNLFVEKTESQVSDTWQQVVRDEDNDIETDVWSKSFSGTVYYYSEYEPELNNDQTAYDGNFWHYDEDGFTPVIWEYTPADENSGTEGLAYSAVSGGVPGNRQRHGI